MLDGLAQRYGCTPSAIMGEPMDLILEIHQILRLAYPDQYQEQEPTKSPEQQMEESLVNLSRT